MKRFFIFTIIVLTSLAFLCTGCGKLTNETNTDPEPPNNIPADVLPGVFSVSSTKKVHFSKGNLVATIDASGAPTAWKFAANQYDYLGEGGANKTIGSAAGDVDLFGWSTNATNNNWGIHTKTSATQDYTTGNFNDWGKAYCEKNRIAEGTWCTLSADEWQYLINKNDDENIRKGKYKYGATVCEKANCLILVPDECLNGYSFNNTKTSYSIEEWATAEAAGLVCLPAAGGRNGSYVDDVGDYGFYWSSAALDSDLAYYVYFSSSTVYPDNFDYRNLGFSVRLITESN